MKFCCSDATMPGLVCKSPPLPRQTSGSIADCCQGGIIPCLHKDDVDSRQLSRYWSELSSAARRKLLCVDKQSLFEKVRKNFYCSRCNGLLLEAFSQLAAYSKSHQGGSLSCEKHVCGYNECSRRGCISSIPSEDDVRDPTVHPWGGLIATREGMLTLLDSFWDGQSLDVIKNVCDCARARDRERELLYPDACGGGGRGWITQGSFASSRGHSLKETCALHTARLSCDALVDFWCALGDETRRSLLRMKEEDFIARLMFRFESKRFCRDCRRNVLKELKELKELKRTRKEPKCTRWFCNADTAFQYEVSSTSVNVNWKECFGGDFGSTYQYFEWALGSAEGNADIFAFENVGLSEGAGVDGLNLSQVSLFYITLRAWKHDGRCTEVSVKAHGLKGKQCVHRRLLVGDGHVTITKGDSIKRFFEHAEEAEEDEDDDAMDKSGSEPENEGYRAQKHAKSPELAREFLLDAATIIFKEQVEKAFREGTARQNAHTIFVCLALNLLEERIHVAYKEISTLEKQKQLLEEEEHEKREEQRRRERKRLKEKEKKSRRKGKQKGGVSEKETCKCVLQPVCNTTIDCDSGVAGLVDENGGAHTDDETKDSGTSIPDDGISNYIPDIMQASNLESMQGPDCSTLRSEALDHFDLSMPMDNIEELSTVDGDSSFPLERSKRNRRRSRPRRGPFMEVISRRFIRRSSITSFDAIDGLQNHMNVSCTSVRETSEVVTEQVFLSTPKFRRGFIRSERNMKSNSVEGGNNRCLHQRQNGLVLHGTSNRSFYFKSKQNDGTGWVGKKCLSLKGSQRKNSVVIGNQKITRMGSFVSGSSQCSWQIIKGMATGRAERELLGHDALVDSEVVSSNSSSESEKMNEPECKEGISAGADSLVNAGRHAACDIVSLGCSTDCFVGEHQHNLKVVSTDRCQPELVFPTLDSTALVQGLKPTDRAVSVSTGEDLNDTGSPSSAMSCVSDSSDGIASCSMRTECSNFGANCSSIVAPSTELLISIPAEHQIHTREPIQQGLDTDYLRKDCDFAHKHDNHQAVSAVGRRTGTEYFPYSTAGNIPAHFYDYNRVHEHMRIFMNSEVSLLDSIPHMCNTDSTMPLSILPVSLMPLHMPQPFGFPWVPSQCMAEPVMNAGLLPLPYYPGNLYMDGFGPSTAGMQASFLPLQPPVQPLPHFMGISCIPMPSMHQIFTQWSEQQPIYDDRKRVEPLPIRNALEENGPRIDLLIEEQSSRFSNPPSAAQATNMPSNDPLGFSLFHFGSLSTDEQELMLLSQAEGGIKEPFKPLDVSCGRAVQQEAAAVGRSSLPEQEYSLFAATPSSRFGFF